MPIYNPDHVEYEVNSGHIQIAIEDGTMLPAYWAHPTLGAVYPGVVLLHDWWGVTATIRRMAMLFAQFGYYVITPDLFRGKTATTHPEALELVNSLGDNGYERADAALTVLENHHNCNGHVAVIGLGLGGGLAFEAAIKRDDLEAAVTFGGFPQRYLGRFDQANIPILAFYGSQDQFISTEMIDKLRQELAASPLGLPHEVVLLQGARHDIFAEDLPEAQRDVGRVAWHKTLDFLESTLEGPSQPPERKSF